MVYAPTRGFTLIEILVVVTIISIMAGTVTFFAMQASQTGRNADRQADLRALQAAVEAYKRDNGRYPEGCRGSGVWSGEPGTAFACTSGNLNEYIRGLVPNYIRVLPRDPNRSGCDDETGQNCGYAYIINAARDVYKIIAMNTVEGENAVLLSDAFKSCAYNRGGDLDPRTAGYCSVIPNAVNNASQINAGHVCHPDNPRFQHSYAVWGGFAQLRGTPEFGVNPSGEGCVTTIACIDNTPNDPRADVLDSFSDVLGNTTNPTGAQQRNLRVRALKGTTEIICQ